MVTVVAGTVLVAPVRSQLVTKMHATTAASRRSAAMETDSFVDPRALWAQRARRRAPFEVRERRGESMKTTMTMMFPTPNDNYPN
jgi:hypothetical protein